jgi:hypothetical protein
VSASVRKKIRKTTATCLAAMLLTSLTSCSSVLEFLNLLKKEDPNTYPSGYRTELLDYLKRNPTAITRAREASISAPSMKPFGSDSRYFVCLKTDDDGTQVEKIAVFVAARIVQFIDAGEECGRAFYQPFPELVAMLAQAGAKQ